MSCCMQGHHPFAYALAELIDNSLRATRHRAAAGQPRTIEVTRLVRYLACLCRLLATAQSSDLWHRGPSTAIQHMHMQVSLVTAQHSNSMKGLVCVQDNGRGMNKQELNEWAIMNLSMEVGPSNKS